MIVGAALSDAATFWRMEPAGAERQDGQAKGRVSGNESSAVQSRRWTSDVQRSMFFLNENRHCHVVS
jgi:hypothetical protein